MPSRPRRLLLALLALPVLFLFLLYFYARSSDVFAVSTPDEIFGLLHFVTSPDEAGRVIRAPGDPPTPNADGAPAFENTAQLGDTVLPAMPVDLTWYALGSIAKSGEHKRVGRGRVGLARGGWDERLRVLREAYPLVVFSKSYCPYSKRVKKLLETYALSPAPKIIEVDLRADASHIKTLLARLTHHSTFPNVILHGRSLGGSDDLRRLHEEDRLRQVLETAGVKVGWMGEGGEGVIL